MMNNPKPMSMRKTVQLMVILTLLAWATQTLFRQWGYGAVIFADAVVAHDQPDAAGAASASGPATLELRDRVDATGDLVTLRDVCRWSEQDAATLDSLGDLVLARLGKGGAAGVRKVTVSDVRAALHDAGANLPAIEISGAAACAVVKGEVDKDEIRKAMSGEASSALAADEPAATPSTQPAGAAAPEPVMAEAPQTPLKELLVNDLLERLAMKKDDVQIEFDPHDAPALELTAPRFTFQFDTARAGGLGPIAWDVIIKNDQGERKATVSAKLRAWEDQLVLTHPLSRGQAILKSDVATRRVLVDKTTDEKLTKGEQAIGEVASRDLKRGDTLTVESIAAAPAVQPGDFVTVSLKIAGTDVETVARALDAGPRGGNIRAKNEANGQVYTVRVTGPGTGEVTTAAAQRITNSNNDVASTTD